MKLKIFATVFMATLGLGATSTVYAVENINYGLQDSGDKAGYTTVGKGKLVNLLPLVGQILGIVLSMIGVALFGLFLYAGIRWLIARGNEEDITKSKDIMEAAVIGMVIIFAAWGLASWVLKNLGVGGGEVTGDHTGVLSICVCTNPDDANDFTCDESVTKSECDSLCVGKRQDFIGGGEEGIGSDTSGGVPSCAELGGAVQAEADKSAEEFDQFFEEVNPNFSDTYACYCRDSNGHQWCVNIPDNQTSEVCIERCFSLFDAEVDKIESYHKCSS